MKVKAEVHILARGAYCSIISDEPAPSFLDVRLPDGKGVAAGLNERAAEYREKAARFERYARLCEAAAKNFN